MKQESSLFLATAFLLIILACFLQASLFFSPDVGYLLHATNQLLKGGKYVSDIFETNPPMILYLYLPICLVLPFTSLSLLLLTQIYVFCLATLSSLLCWILLKKLSQPEAFVYRYCMISMIMIVLFILPIHAFAQREHLLMILILPYLFAAMLAFEKKTIQPGLAICIGLLAGMGFALKPFFLLPLCFVELALMVERRRLFGWVRIETIAIFVVLIVYLATIWIYQSGYITVILPLVFKYYFPAVKKAWPIVVNNPIVMFCVAIIIPYFVMVKYDHYKTIGKVIFLAFLGMTVAFFIPRTIWYYQMYPALAFVFLLITHFFGQEYLSWYQKEGNNVKELSLLMIIVAIVLFVPVYSSHRYYTIIREFAKINPTVELTKFIDAQEGSRSIYSFTLEGTYRSFPMVYLTHSEFGQRFPAFWWYTGLRILERKEKTSHSNLFKQLKKDRQDLIDRIAEDLNRYQARWVIIDDGFKKVEKNDRFDLLASFLKNETFKTAWQPYRYVTHIGDSDIYERKQQR